MIVDKRSLSSALTFVGSEFEFVAADSILTRLRASVASAWRVVLECDQRRRSRKGVAFTQPVRNPRLLPRSHRGRARGLQAVLARVGQDTTFSPINGNCRQSGTIGGCRALHSARNQDGHDQDEVARATQASRMDALVALVRAQRFGAARRRHRSPRNR
jgi:hypothetical protein